MKKEIEKRIVKDILKLVSIESVTGSNGIKVCQRAVIDIAQKLGFETSIHAKGQVLIIEPNGHQKSSPAKLGIVVHLDTVPFSTSEWEHNPLGELSNGRLYGRGVVDNKGAIILALYAFYLEKPKFDWKIIVGSCEEGIWTDIQDYLAENPVLPEFLITIDGNGIQNGCRGYLDLELIFDNPKNISLSVVDPANNTVPGEAIGQIGTTFIRTTGKTAHSSAPQNGINALTRLCSCLYNITNKPSGFFKLMKMLNTNYNAFCIGFEHHPEEIEGQIVGITSVCPTNAWTDGDKIFVNLSIRLNALVTQKEVDKAIAYITHEFGCEARIVELTLPAYISKDCSEIQKMLFAYESVLGKPTQSTFAMGVGYNAAFPNCAIFGPQFAAEHDEEDTCHAADESRRIEDLMKFFKMFRIFLSLY